MLLCLFFLDVLIKAAFDHQHGMTPSSPIFQQKGSIVLSVPTADCVFEGPIQGSLPIYAVTRSQCDKCSAMTPSDKKSKGAKAAPFQRRPLEIIVWLSGHTYISAVIRRIGSSVSPNTIAAIEEKP